LGAIVSFYFGARELHYVRRVPAAGLRAIGRGRRGGVAQAPAEDPVASNPALSAWRGSASPLDDPLGGR
jgi:hypothetical protein